MKALSSTTLTVSSTITVTEIVTLYGHLSIECNNNCNIVIAIQHIEGSGLNKNGSFQSLQAWLGSTS